MQAVIDFIVGLVAALAALALAQFGIDVNTPHQNEPEVRRVVDCPDPPAGAAMAKAPSRTC